MSRQKTRMVIPVRKKGQEEELRYEHVSLIGNPKSVTVSGTDEGWTEAAPGLPCCGE